MKKILFLLTSILSVNVSAEQLHNYAQIKDAVSNGKLVRVFIDYSDCDGPFKGQSQHSFSGVYTPNEIAINNDANYLATSLNHFTTNDPQFPDKPIYEYNRYTIYSDGKVTLAMQAFDAQSYAPLNSKVTFTCTIDKTARFYIA